MSTAACCKLPKKCGENAMTFFCRAWAARRKVFPTPRQNFRVVAVAKNEMRVEEYREYQVEFIHNWTDHHKTPMGVEFLVSNITQPYSRSAMISTSFSVVLFFVESALWYPFSFADESLSIEISGDSDTSPTNWCKLSAKGPLLSLQIACMYDRTR